MVLTEEEKKEYLINYQPTQRFLSFPDFLLLFFTCLGVSFVLTELNKLGYTNIDLNNVPKIIFFMILVFAVVRLIDYAFDKWFKK